MLNLKRIYLTRRRALSAFVLMITLIAATGTTFVFPVKAAGSLSPASSLTPEQIEAAIEEYFEAVSAHDVQRYVNTFAPNGVLEDPVGTPPLQGTTAITGFITNIIAPFSEIKHRIQEVVVCGNEAAVNWKLQLKTTSGKHITIDGMGVFIFNQDGKLQSVREFWDLAAFLTDLQG
ncbi:MAG: nuclear transport factor 2 family protein [Blastocatellia bacterium]